MPRSGTRLASSLMPLHDRPLPLSSPRTAMAWKLFGHATTPAPLPAELRSILAQMQRERVAFEVLTAGARDATQQLTQLTQPIAEAQKVVAELQGRVKALERLVPVLATLDEQTEGVSRTQRRTETQVEHTAEEVKHLRTEIEQLRATFDAALALKGDLTSLLESAGGLKSLRADADALTGQVHNLSTTFDRAQQREAVDRALGRATQLDDVMQDIDAKIRTHQHNAESLGALDTRVTELRALHGDLLAQSQEINARHDQIVQTDRELHGRLSGLRDEAQQTVKRFEEDAAQLAQTVEHMTARVARLEQAQPAFDAALRDFAGLKGTHQEVKDALECMRLADSEIGRAREAQAGTKTWLSDVTESVEALRGELAAVEDMKPTVEAVRRDADGLSHAMAQIESRRQLVEQLNTRLSRLAAAAAQLDERTGGLGARMDTADQQFQAVAAHAEEAARIEKLVPTVIGTVDRAERRMAQMDAAVRALEARAQRLETLAEETRALGRELEVRRTALDSATEHLARASELRPEAATIAQQLEKRAGQFNGALTGATDRTAALTTTLDDLETRAGDLRFVHKRMAQFEEHLAKWHASEAQLMRALEQTAQRQATVDALQADLYRLFEVAQRTVDHVRAIAAANTRQVKSA